MPSAIEFENISKQYRLGLVGTGTLSHDLNRFWQTKVLRRDNPNLKVGETNDCAHKGNSDYVWAPRTSTSRWNRAMSWVLKNELTIFGI